MSRCQPTPTTRQRIRVRTVCLPAWQLAVGCLRPPFLRSGHGRTLTPTVRPCTGRPALLAIPSSRRPTQWPVSAPPVPVWCPQAGEVLLVEAVRGVGSGPVRRCQRRVLVHYRRLVEPSVKGTAPPADRQPVLTQHRRRLTPRSRHHPPVQQTSNPCYSTYWTTADNHVQDAEPGTPGLVSYVHNTHRTAPDNAGAAEHGDPPPDRRGRDLRTRPRSSAWSARCSPNNAATWPGPCGARKS